MVLPSSNDPLRVESSSRNAENSEGNFCQNVGTSLTGCEEDGTMLAGNLAPPGLNSARPAWDVGITELAKAAEPHGCSQDCAACRDLSFALDVSPSNVRGPPIKALVPPVVLVGRAPDTSTVNQWPPFGCGAGRGIPMMPRPPSCTGPICFRHRPCTPATAEVQPPPPNTIHCKNVQYPCEAFLIMNELRKAEGNPLCDVRIQAGRQLFPAHRIVLAASSEYFRAMFTMGMKEAKEDLIKLENICPRILGKLIDFCYTSEITVGERWICKILPAAVMLQMSHDGSSGVVEFENKSSEGFSTVTASPGISRLRHACSLGLSRAISGAQNRCMSMTETITDQVIDCCTHFLESQLDPYNAIGIAEFASQHGCTVLTRIAREFIDKNFGEVSQNDEFLQLSVGQVIDLIKRDEIVVHSESEVYDAVMQWIRFDEKARRPYLEKIVSAVRCHFLTPSFLEQQLNTCDVLKSHPDCRKYLENIVQELTAHKKCLSRKRTNPDLPTVVYVVGGTTRYSLNRLDCYDPRGKRWRGLTDMPTHRSGVSSAFVYGLLYVTGGRCTLPESNSDDSAEVEAYDPFGEAWRSCPPMSVARNRGGAMNTDNILYVVGGSMQTAFHKSGERYDPSEERWTPIADMSRARLGLGVASLNRLLYAVGGFDGVERLKCVECYNPDTDEWRYVKPMASERSGAGVASLDGFIYAVGGYDGRSQLAYVERYDPEQDIWEPRAPLNTARSALCLVALEGKLLAIGGYDGFQFSPTVESYDPKTDVWSPETPLPEGRSGHGAAVWWGSCCRAPEDR